MAQCPRGDIVDGSVNVEKVDVETGEKMCIETSQLFDVIKRIRKKLKQCEVDEDERDGPNREEECDER